MIAIDQLVAKAIKDFRFWGMPRPVVAGHSSKVKLNYILLKVSDIHQHGLVVHRVGVTWSGGMVGPTLGDPHEFAWLETGVGFDLDCQLISFADRDFDVGGVVGVVDTLKRS